MEAPLHRADHGSESVRAEQDTAFSLVQPNAKLVLLEQLLEASERLEDSLLFACQSDVVQDRADVDSLELLAERDERVECSEGKSEGACLATLLEAFS